jgi:hypothetical protein
LVFEEGFFGGVAVVDENEANLPIFEPQAGNDLGNGAVLGKFEGVESGSFFEGLQVADGFDENNHSCGFQVPGCRLGTIRNGGLGKKGAIPQFNSFSANSAASARDRLFIFF